MMARQPTTSLSGRGTASAADAALADAFLRRLVVLVYLYPLFWVIGLGALFFPVAAVLSLPYLVRVRLGAESWIALGIAICIFLSIPVGLLSFGFEPLRALSALGNIAVWITVAAGLSAAQFTSVRPRLSYALITVAGIQGAATMFAVLIYPQQLPLPLLRDYAAALPTGFRQFAIQPLAYSGWLEGFSIRSAGFMANPTWVGAFAALAALVALAEISRKKYQLRLIVAVLLCGVSVYYSLSRSTYLVIALALAVAAIFLLRRRSRHAFVTTIAIAVPALAMALVAGWAQITDAIVRINAARAGSLVERMAIYDRTWQYWWQELRMPLIGFGIKPQESDLWSSVASHSTYLGLTFRGGAIAFLLLIALLISMSRQVLINNSALGAAILVVITLWMVIGDIDVGHMLPLFLAFCVGGAECKKSASRPAMSVEDLRHISSEKHKFRPRYPGV